jgi:two-component system, chemotaxis family, sensor kinase CheA
VGSSIDVQEFLRGFLDEAEEHLRRITSSLVVLEEAPDRAHPHAIVELLRALHTLKGLAGMMAVEPIVELAHAMESPVRATQRYGGVLPAAALDPLVAGAGALTQRIRAMADGSPVPAAPEAVLLALERLASEPGPAQAEPWAGELVGLEPALVEKLAPGELDALQQAIARGERALRVTFAPSPARADEGHTITSVRAALEGLGEIVRVLPRSVPRAEATPGGLEFVLLVVTRALPQQLAAAAGVTLADVGAIERVAVDRPVSAAMAPSDDDPLSRASRRGVVRMHVAKLDTALECLSGLSIGQRHLREEARALAGNGVDVRALEHRLGEQDRQLRRMRSTLLELRMVPLQEVLEPLPLIVRGLRNSTGKQVRLVVDVGEAELDKTVAERLFPALVHVVRNAVDHGIEDVQTRRARGKPEEGLVRVTAAAPAAATLEVSISDDGGGIDPVAVARRAGRPVPGTVAELLDILAMPGFSTRDAATATSGRGVGLDIVRQTVETLGGTLVLDNRPGQGTTLRVRAPLTLALLDALAFEAGHERYLAPLGVVDAVVELDPAQVVRPPRGQAAGCTPGLLHVRGDVVPLVSLRDALGLPSADDERKAMIIRRHGQPFAFGIDRMIGCHEVLVRPLADPLVAVRGVTGAADLGDGRPTLVLDLGVLVARLSRSTPDEVTP